MPELPSGCVLTIGNFDGVHVGHKALLDQVRKVAKNYQLPSIAMLFEPQPLEYFNPGIAPARLTSFREKYQEIKKVGIDYLLCVPFKANVANLSADKFIRQWLVNYLSVKYLVVGYDFTFGAHRQGNVDVLRRGAKDLSFKLAIVPPYNQHDHRISSTIIRQALAAEQFGLAGMLLGRQYAIWGKVVHGNERGRQLGFPTANINLHRVKAALSGVYLVDVDDLTVHRQYRGIANIGCRPTVNGTKSLLEVNIFNFNNDIYGHYLQVTFLKKIREEQKFASLDKLKIQIMEDVCIAQKMSEAL